ncbi:MAG: MBL fold metallo-hydrolase [Bacteroidales bacterium]|jgi:glyoxylase-like metal-dependent hydrolase (beta-lactamase superfamily II)|nr:MBL fold metallo-hydrolase [Bacteroidales bacterium]
MKMRTFLITIINLLIINNLFSQENLNVYTYKFGDMQVSLLQEISKYDKPTVLIGLTDEILNECAPDDTIPGAVNAFFLQANGKNILIDSGYGTKLFDNLKFLGIGAEDIDIVLLTHLHGDHISGMMKNGRKSFPNADVYLSQREHDYWLKETEDERSHAMLSEYKDRLHTLHPNKLGEKAKDFLPGIQAYEAYGHTPGHTVYLFTSSEKQFLIIGDVINVAAIQFPYPNIPAIYDKNAEEASATKVIVLDFASKHNIPIAGMHISYPGMGNVTKNNKGGFIFKPMK